MVFVASQMVSEQRCVQRGAYGKTVPIRPLDLPVEVIHPPDIAGIPVPKQFPGSQFCFGKLLAVGIDPLPISGKIGIAQRAERGNFRTLDDLHLAVPVVEADLSAVLCIALGRTRIVLAVVQHLEGCQICFGDSPAGGVDGCFVHGVSKV